jgi:hypothetical protein
MRPHAKQLNCEIILKQSIVAAVAWEYPETMDVQSHDAAARRASGFDRVSTIFARLEVDRAPAEI